MKNILAIMIATIMLATACKPLENTVKLANTKAPVVRKDITYAYSDDQIRTEDNNLKKGWAKRKNVQVLNVNIINNSNKTIHGSQLGFYSAGERLKIIDNQLAAEKLKSKKFPAAVYVVPIFIVGYVVYAGLMSLLTGSDNLNTENMSFPEKTDEAKDPLYKANELQKQLYYFNIAKQVIRPGGQISGFIAFRSKTTIDILNIEVRKVDYEVIGTY